MKKYMTKPELFQYSATLLPVQPDGTPGLSKAAIGSILVRHAPEIKVTAAGRVCVEDFVAAVLKGRERKREASLSASVPGEVDTQKAVKVRMMQKQDAILGETLRKLKGETIPIETVRQILADLAMVFRGCGQRFVQNVQSWSREPVVNKAAQRSVLTMYRDLHQELKQWKVENEQAYTSLKSSDCAPTGLPGNSANLAS